MQTQNDDIPSFEDALSKTPATTDDIPSFEDALAGKSPNSSKDVFQHYVSSILQPSIYASNIIIKSFGYDQPNSAQDTLHPETIEAMKRSGEWEDYQKEHSNWQDALVKGAVRPESYNLQERIINRTGEYLHSALQGIGQGYEEGTLIPTNFAKAATNPDIAGLLIESGKIATNVPFQAGASLFKGVQNVVSKIGEDIGGPALGRDLALALENAGIMHPASYGRFQSLHEAAVVSTIKEGVANGIVGVPESVAMGLKEPTPAQRIKMEKAQQELPSNQEKITYYNDQINNLQEAIKRNPVKEDIFQAKIKEIEDIRNNIEAQERRSTGLTIDRAVRMEKPEIFAEYDAAESRINLLRDNIARLKDEHKSQLEQTAPHTDEIKELRSSLEEKSARQQKIAQKKIDELTDKRQQWIDEQYASETPEISKLRQGIQDLDIKRRELAPEVSEAYRNERAKRPAEEVIPSEAESYIPEQKAEKQVLPDITKGELPWGKINIAEDFRDKAIAAGRTAEQANAEAALVESHYKAISEQGWTKGTPEEIYLKHMAEIKSGKKNRGIELEQPSRGSIRLAADNTKSIIKLFQRQDASTLVHELGHHWLDEMMTWAKATDAPEGLIEHSTAVRQWLGKKEGEFSGFTRAQHEKFARGFERYLMEGVAPSRELANVFAQFRDWLTAIYQTVKNLRSEITPEVRNVFDHMLSSKPERVVISREAKAAETMANELPKTEKPAVAPVEEIAAPKQVAEDVITTPQEDIARMAASEQPTVAIAEDNIAPSTVKEEVPSTEVRNPNQSLPQPRGDLVDKAGNIRLENLTDNNSVKEGIRQLAAQEENFLDARRGVVSDAEISELADSMGIADKEINIEHLRKLSVDDGIPLAARIKAARKMLVQAEIEARTSMQKVIDTQGNTESLMEFADARRRFLMIGETVSGVTAEWGRAGRAFRDISKEQMASTAALDELFQKMAGMNIDEMKRMAKNPQNFDTPAKMAKYLQDSTKPSFFKMLIEYRLAAMLYGPKTHIKNFVSNTALAINAALEFTSAATIGKGFELLGKERGVTFDEAAAHWQGMSQGSIEGWAAAKAILKDENAATSTRTVETTYQHAIPGKIGELIRTPFRALSASDEFFKSIAFRQSINSQAIKIANKERLLDSAKDNRVAELIRNPTEGMMETAKKYADYQTLTKALEGTALKTQMLVNSNFILKNIVPFFRTNYNSIEYFLKDRSPLGLLSREIRDNLSGKNGAAARDIQIARTTMGTAMVGVAVNMVMNGTATGAGPKDKNERYLWLKTHQPYSFKIKDTWYSYEGLQGFSSPFGIAADVAETVMHGQQEQKDVEKIVLGGVGAISKRLLNMASLQGISDTVQATANPDQYFDRWLRNYLTSYIPNFVPTVANAMDPELRQVNSMIDAFKNKTPFYREELLPSRDIFGDPIKSEGSWGPDILSPVFQRTTSTDPVVLKLQQLRKFPSNVSKNIRGVKLDDQQYDDYQRIAGRLLKDRLDIAISRPGFSAMPEFAQINIINDIIENTRESARGLIMMKYPEIIKKAIAQKTKR